jgi:hypothetical protein
MHRLFRRTFTLAVALGVALGGLSAAVGVRADQPLPAAVPSHQHYNGLQGVLDTNGDGQIGVSTFKNVSGPICTTPISSAANVNTDCEATAPHNETSIAVNPTNPLNMIGSANDYQLRAGPNSTYETIFSRAHVTVDGGKTWTTVGIVYNSYGATGDPAVAFDADGRAYLATLGFKFSQGKSPGELNPDILVATSSNGGTNWSGPSRVASGSGSSGSVGVFNDKEYVTAWGHGNAIVTWTHFNDGNKGSYISSPIYDSVTHDGGQTWSAPTQISGSAPFCLGAQGGTPCDQDQGSVPVVAADGSIYVAFESTFDATTGRDQYLVVKVDPASGASVAGPFKVAQLVDGVTDYPIDAEGRQTYQDSQFRTWSLGNIAADPTNAKHLAVVWSDMRNSTLPAPTNPYSATTNSDVVVSQSFDGGQTWSAPVAIAAAGDQFMPWAVYDTSGRLRTGYFDRSYDPANHQYGYTLATETSAGSLSFATTQMTTVLSDPTQGDRWFSSLTVNPNFSNPTSFLGDYSGIAALPGGGVVGLWTDMRNNVCFTTRCGSGEDAYAATAP